MTVKIKDKLYKGILAYCQLNELLFEDYVNELLEKQFMIDRYGTRPFISNKGKETSEVEDKIEIQTKTNKKDNVINEPINEPIKKEVAELKTNTLKFEVIDEEPEEVNEDIKPKKKIIRKKLN